MFNGLWELPIGDVEPGKPPADNCVTKVFGHIEFAPILAVEAGGPSSADRCRRLWHARVAAFGAAVNPVFGANFLHPLSGAGARQIQFSLDFEF